MSSFETLIMSAVLNRRVGGWFDQRSSKFFCKLSKQKILRGNYCTIWKAIKFMKCFAFLMLPKPVDQSEVCDCKQIAVLEGFQKGSLWQRWRGLCLPLTLSWVSCRVFKSVLSEQVKWSSHWMAADHVTAGGKQLLFSLVEENVP